MMCVKMKKERDRLFFSFFSLSRRFISKKTKQLFYITSLFLRISQSSAAAESIVLREERSEIQRREFFELDFFPLSSLSLSLFLCELASKFTLKNGISNRARTREIKSPTRPHVERRAHERASLRRMGGVREIDIAGDGESVHERG